MARVQLSDSWIVDGNVSTQQDKLLAFFKTHKMEIKNKQGSEISVNQGSQFLTRLLGGWFVPASWIPKCATVNIHQLEKGVQIDAKIEESLGFGILDGFFKKKYQTYFELWMTDLKKTIQ